MRPKRVYPSEELDEIALIPYRTSFYGNVCSSSIMPAFIYADRHTTGISGYF